MATTALRCTLRVSAPASLTKTTLRRAAPRRAAPPARAAKNRGEGAPTELAQRSRKDELVFDSAPALASAPSGASLARQLYSEACEAAVNAQINIEYGVSYTYHAMWAYFSRDDVALPGLASWFAACSLEERDHAAGLMNYQNLRGGRVALGSLAPPPAEFGGNGVDDALAALSTALALERTNYTKLLELRAVAEAAGDAHLTGYCDGLLEDQVASVRKCSDFVAQVRRCGPGYGTWAWDKALGEAVAAAGGGAAAADAVGAIAPP